MDELGIINLYEESSKNKNKEFIENVNSNLRVITNYDKTSCSFEWLDIMENTIKYLDNILRNPNRFIINEEDIVKVKLARRVTVESIKHLSRNTNLIQDIDKKTGDVKPSKILNINKEESFNTYENRFIYSLIKNMQFFINKKKRNIDNISMSSKNNKSMEYNATNRVGKEKIDVSLSINSKIEEKSDNKKNGELSIPKRIEKLELQISDLTCSQVYQNIDKLHITLVTSPIKKTNVILKNVNFQYAVKLWNYLQEHYEEEPLREKENKDYQENGELKQLIDESFLLDYLVLDSINKKDKKKDKKEEISEKLVDNMIEKVMRLDETIDEEKLKELVGKQFSIIKYKTVVNEKQIEKIFRKHLDKYLKVINEIKI